MTILQTTKIKVEFFKEKGRGLVSYNERGKVQLPGSNEPIKAGFNFVTKVSETERINYISGYQIDKRMLALDRGDLFLLSSMLYDFDLKFGIYLGSTYFFAERNKQKYLILKNEYGHLEISDIYVKKGEQTFYLIPIHTLEREIFIHQAVGSDLKSISNLLYLGHFKDWKYVEPISQQRRQVHMVKGLKKFIELIGNENGFFRDYSLIEETLINNTEAAMEFLKGYQDGIFEVNKGSSEECLVSVLKGNWGELENESN